MNTPPRPRAAPTHRTRMSLGLAVAAACALLEPSVPAPSAPAPPAAPSNATWPWLTDECKLTEPYDCVAKGACGFCVSTWTCVPGDEHGPIAVSYTHLRAHET